MSATTAMEVNAEARRILAVSISKLYASRTQRGGLRLHRSLLLSLVMRSARDIYHSSRESEELSGAQPAPVEQMDTTSSNTGEPAGQPEPQPEPTPVLNSADLAPEQPDNEEEEEEGCDSELIEDKENMSPTRQSRKRRGKASAAPDFLPSKRARLEPGEERYAAPLGSCRVGAGDSLTALSLNRVIPAF
ncbi:immediate early response 2b [Scomber scombrus]|uniref:Immediate early response 2b n=1 Tax=Scomber scombrus TaxID=13677 RepID=A0AAV1PZG8_SCOSC|nr:immediate early response gene 2 protein-like [Scomber scombrus]